MIIVLGISELEDFHRPEIPLEKTQEIDNEARISKKAEMKRKFSRNQKRNSIRHPARLSNILAVSNTLPFSLERLMRSETHFMGQKLREITVQ